MFLLLNPKHAVLVLGINELFFALQNDFFNHLAVTERLQYATLDAAVKN